MEWLIANWEQTLLAVFAVLGAASAIAKLTPTEADDAIIQKVLDVIHTIGLTKK